MHYFRKRLGYLIAMYVTAVLCQGVIGLLLPISRWSAFAYVCIYSIAYIVLVRFTFYQRAVTDYNEKRMSLIYFLAMLCACIELIIVGVEWKNFVFAATLGLLSYIVIFLLGRLWKAYFLVAGWTVSVSDCEKGLASNKRYIAKNNNTFMMCGEVNIAEEGSRPKLQKMIELYNPPYVVASIRDELLLKQVYGLCDEMGVMVVENVRLK